MNDPSRYLPPVASPADRGLGVARTLLSAIPLIGGSATELLGALVTPALERRRDQWMAEVGNALFRLEESLPSMQELQANEQFVTTLLRASKVALSTHQLEKRDALRNAVLNSALSAPAEESLQDVFIDLIESLTVWHLRLLQLFHDVEVLTTLHERYFGRFTNGSFATVLEGHFPSLRGQRHLYAQVIRDLYQRGLLDESVDVAYGGIRDGQPMYPPAAFRVKRTTRLAEQFLDFIKRPDPTE